MASPLSAKLAQDVVNLRCFCSGELPVALINPHSGIGVKVGGKMLGIFQVHGFDLLFGRLSVFKRFNKFNGFNEFTKFRKFGGFGGCPG